MNTNDWYDDIEEWETAANFMDAGDYKGLLEYRQRKAETYPNNSIYQWELGEAYILNKEYEKAIKFLKYQHVKFPDDINIQYSLLSALSAIGKDETAVDWINKPDVVRLDKETLDYCYQYLRTKRKPRSVDFLYIDLYSKGYPLFNDEEFMRLLQSDDRFVLSGSQDKSYDCYIAVKRKREVLCNEQNNNHAEGHTGS